MSNQSVGTSAQPLNGRLTFDKDRLSMTYTRVFDAPRELVFKVFTDPELIPQWWGPSGLTTVVDRMDLKVGGTWRFVQRDAQGNTYAFNGVYREITPPERIVQTFEFESEPGQISLETATFEEIDGKTLVTASSVYPSLEAFEGVMSSGMEAGMIETYDRAEQLLQRLQTRA